MSQRLATPAPATRLPALLSLIGSSIICAGFLYPCLYIRLSYVQSCISVNAAIRCTLQGITPGSEMLSGAQILNLNHPIMTHIITGNPPYPTSASFDVIVPPLTIIPMLALIAGVILLLVSIYAARVGLKPWLFGLALITAGVGIASLIFNTWHVFVDPANVYYAYLYPTGIPPLGIAGHVLLYIGYALALAGIITMYRQQRRTLMAPQLAPTPSVA